MKRKSTLKQETMAKWNGMKENQPILKHMKAIPYKATGSRYGACGIRIDGNPEFIDAVLSHLKELLDGESWDTRLELARNAVDGSNFGKAFSLAERQAECCYIRLHERGGDAKMMNCRLGANGEAAWNGFLAHCAQD